MAGLATPAALRALYTRLRMDFEAAGKTVATPLDELATKVTSKYAFETYGWLEAFPAMREWIGQRLVHGLRQRVNVIYNKAYELTIAIDRDTFDDSELINTQMVTQGMARSANELRTDLILDLLRNGQSRVGYDGQFFFDTDHPTDIDLVTGSQSNYESAAFALTRANYVAARARLRRFSGANGRPFGVGKRGDLVLLVPPELEETALSIVGVNMIAIAGGVQTNTLFNDARVIVVPELTSTPTTWFLFDLSGPVKPFILQERQAPRFQTKGDPSDDNMFWNKEYVFGADARYGASFGLWFKAFKAVG